MRPWICVFCRLVNWNHERPCHGCGGSLPVALRQAVALRA